jgi:hypothetical protein
MKNFILIKNLKDKTEQFKQLVWREREIDREKKNVGERYMSKKIFINININKCIQKKTLPPFHG